MRVHVSRGPQVPSVADEGQVIAGLKAGPRSLAAGLSSRESCVMKALFDRNAQAPYDGPASQPAGSMQAGRACCCPGRPVVTVLVPPSRSRTHVTDLLLCGHHFRVSRDALHAAGATAYDQDGRKVLGPSMADQPPNWDLGTAPRETGSATAHPEHPAGRAYR